MRVVALVRWLSVLALPLATVAPAPAGIAIGGEFQVNLHTVDIQREPAAAMGTGRGFLVVWQSKNQDGSAYGIFARRYSSAGAPLGGELQVNSYTPSYQHDPAVATNGNGDFIVVWDSSYQDGSSRGVFGRRFSSDGTALADELQINSFTPNPQRSPALAVADDGDFVVAWSSSTQDGGSYGIFARRFSSAGGALASEFLVNAYTSGNQLLPAVSVASSGDFVVTWSSSGQDGSGQGIFARRFASDGSAITGELQVNAYTSGDQYQAAVATTAGDEFVVAWHSPQDGSERGVFLRRFTSSGAAIGGELQVNLYTGQQQTAPEIAVDRGGDFVITWNSESDGSNFGAFARLFTRHGDPIGGEFQINTTTAYPQIEPHPAMDATGRFVVAWASVQQDGHDTGNVGIFARRFSAPVLDVDGDGAAEPLTDGLLLLRHLFGFSGTSLVTGAVDLANCSRCSPESIASYLDLLGSELDIDGNGGTSALTDGLLALRYLFGFTGATLINGAVDNGGCSRCDAAQIGDYLGTLGP